MHLASPGCVPAKEIDRGALHDASEVQIGFDRVSSIGVGFERTFPASSELKNIPKRF